MQEVKEINKVVYLSNNDILPNRFQPRKYFDEEEILQLSESIKEHGVINPVIVRKLGDKYELVAGERRYKANILAGNDDIPAIIMDVNDKESSEIAVVENIQRKDLNAIEEAISYKRILDIGYMTQEQLAQKMGKSQSAIANKIRLLKLSDEVQDALMKKQISERHARSLLKLESHKSQNQLLERIINERLTVRKTDEEIEKMNNMNNFNNIYNNIPNNNNNDILAPIMPGTNVSDINISGENNVETQNNGIINPAMKPIMTNITNEKQAVNSPTNILVEQQAEQPFVRNQQTINPSVSPISAEQQVIPTVSIDDVLAKANQPSVVGNASLVQNELSTPIENDQKQNSITNNNSVNYADNFKMPNLNPINEEATPISEGLPELGSINEISSEINNNQILKPIETGSSIPEKSQESLNSSNNFGIPDLNPISENPQPVDDFLNSMNNNSILSPSSNIQTDTNNSINTFTSFNLNRDDTATQSPINTSPIIDTTVVNSNQNANTLNNNPSISAVSQPIKPIPEPIIVNDYNAQYDPIMPQQQNQHPTIDLKTIINLIRKCSQAIENSGYKIETEEYNLDNLYQVVFKIEKQ